PIFHILAVLSQLAVTIVFPSGENDADSMLSSCPRRVRTILPVSGAHTLAILSSPAVTNKCPFDEKETLLTDLSLRNKTRSSFPCFASQMVTSVAFAVTIRLLSGENTALILPR